MKIGVCCSVFTWLFSAIAPIFKVYVAHISMQEVILHHLYITGYAVFSWGLPRAVGLAHASLYQLFTLSHAQGLWFINLIPVFPSFFCCWQCCFSTYAIVHTVFISVYAILKWFPAPSASFCAVWYCHPCSGNGLFVLGERAPAADAGVSCDVWVWRLMAVPLVLLWFCGSGFCSSKYQYPVKIQSPFAWMGRDRGEVVLLFFLVCGPYLSSCQDYPFSSAPSGTMLCSSCLWKLWLMCIEVINLHLCLPFSSRTSRCPLLRACHP